MWRSAVAIFVTAVCIAFVWNCDCFAPTSCDPREANCPDAFFGMNYFQCRTKFLQAAKDAQAEITRYLVMEEAGMELTMDVAVIRGGLEGQLLVHTSGVHGVEGYAGSAVQVYLLRRFVRLKPDMSRMPTLVFVHAVNPYGFAMNRRYNENNVDLNRNYFIKPEQWERVLKRDPNIASFDDFAWFFNGTSMPGPFEMQLKMLTAGWLLLKNGFAKGKRALVTGQYHAPTGLFYGGTELQPSLKLLNQAMEPFISTTKQGFIIHVHTGLGPEGVDVIGTGKQSTVDISPKVFPGRRMSCGTCSVAPGPSSVIEEGYELVEGEIAHRFDQIFKSPSDVHSLTQEFGTVSPMRIATTLAVENAAFNSARGTHVHESAALAVRDCFFVQKLSWKQSVLDRGVALFDEALVYLAATR